VHDSVRAQILFGVVTASNALITCRTGNLPNPRLFGNSADRKFYTSSRVLIQWCVNDIVPYAWPEVVPMLPHDRNCGTVVAVQSTLLSLADLSLRDCDTAASSFCSRPYAGTMWCVAGLWGGRISSYCPDALWRGHSTSACRGGGRRFPRLTTRYFALASTGCFIIHAYHHAHSSRAAGPATHPAQPHLPQLH